jgi:hypothetical protein
MNDNVTFTVARMFRERTSDAATFRRIPAYFVTRTVTRFFTLTRSADSLPCDPCRSAPDVRFAQLHPGGGRQHSPAPSVLRGVRCCPHLIGSNFESMNRRNDNPLDPALQADLLVSSRLSSHWFEGPFAALASHLWVSSRLAFSGSTFRRCSHLVLPISSALAYRAKVV